MTAAPARQESPDLGRDRHRRGRRVWAVCWAALTWLLFASVTALTLTLWATRSGYRDTTPVSDLSFFALGAMIAAGFASQVTSHARPAGVGQGMLAASALTLCGLAGRRVEPFVGGLVFLAATTVQWTLHPRPTRALREPSRASRPGVLLAFLAAAAGVGNAASLIEAALGAGPSCFLGRCASGDRLVEMAATAAAIPALAALSAMRVEGWRLPLWSAGFAAMTLGATSVAWPQATGSLGVAGGSAAVVWAICHISFGEHDRVRHHRRETS